MITGILMLLCSWWILTRLRKPKQTKPVTQKEPALAGLTEQVALDAIAREQRAKAALTVLLRREGCSEQEINEILGSIDAGHNRDVVI